MTGVADAYLDRAQSLELSKKSGRRSAVYFLKEFYGQVMNDLGQNELGISSSIKNDTLSQQWGRISRRLEFIEGHEVEEEYDGLISRIHEARNRVAHNYDFDPSKSNIEELTHKADGWRLWLTNQCNKYERLRGELNPRQSIIQIIFQTASTIASDTSRLDSERSSAESLLQDLDPIETKETDVITDDLLSLLQDAIALSETQKPDVEDGLTDTEKRVLEHLREHPHTDCSTLSKELDLSQVYMRRILRRLDEEGNIRLERGSPIPAVVLEQSYYVITGDRNYLLEVVEQHAQEYLKRAKEMNLTELQKLVMDEIADAVVAGPRPVIYDSYEVLEDESRNRKREEY